MSDLPIPTIVFALIAALIVFGFFSIFFRTSPDEDIAFPIVARTSSPGLDAGVIETLPIFLYSQVKHLKIGKGALECAVCLNEFEDDNEMLRLLPICDHAFHRECIDEWLSSHTTCPVCRANLARPVVNEQQPHPPASVEPESSRDEISVTIADDDDQPRSKYIKSTMWSKFPRSHSTGHSLVQPGENMDRFTLKLPDHIRQEIMSRALNLNQTKTTSALPGETSSRSGYRESYRRLGSLDRWMFSMAPPFLARESPMRKWKSNRSTSGSEGTGSYKRFNLIGRLSFNRFGNSKSSEPGLIASN